MTRTLPACHSTGGFAQRPTPGPMRFDLLWMNMAGSECCTCTESSFRAAPGTLLIINRNPLDNRRCNLREATRSQNAVNSRKKANASSRFKGVAWYKPRRQWRSALVVQGKLIDLGFFDDERAAALAYDTEARKQYGDFARLNFPEVQA